MTDTPVQQPAQGLVGPGSGAVPTTTIPPQQEQQCPTGEHFDVNANGCVQDTTLAPNLQPEGLVGGEPPIIVSQFPNGSCPPGYHEIPRDDRGRCTTDAPTTSLPPVSAPPATPPINHPLPPTYTGVVPANPDGSCPAGTSKIDIRCVGVLPGSTTGAGGGFIQMIPTQAPQPQPAGNSPLATQTPATPPPPSTPTSTPPATPPTVCPPTQHYDTSQQKCVDG